MSKAVFITGVTGYIGGETLAQLLKSPTTKGHKYSALVRNQAKAQLLESLGVRPVIGTLDDRDLLIAEAKAADVVIHTADSSDHVASCEALLEGIRQKGEETIYIHISGTGVLIDDARGEYATDNIYSDLNPDHINSLPPTAFHRNVELMILNASSELGSKIKTHIVLPSTIYGIADNVLVQKGIANNISMQMPELIRLGIARGQGGVMGKGLNCWPNIHIKEIGEIIALVFEKALEGKTATGWEGYYFGESGEYRGIDAARAISKALSTKFGIGQPEPTVLTDEDVKKYLKGCITSRIIWEATHVVEENAFEL
ncbi:hypothetical protein Clacol_008264 [Clathrus columnatus]|uniref:NmrA-like domain-containing protein n=1 Tax=Clathrus columnatus TaxID=1419009 RepID=A0AAV5AK17_9AGAM|nr:hypothetical protein Clacol_008264 [Clathrus columnatus]